MTKDLLSLPLISPLADRGDVSSSGWNGFTAVGAVAESAAAAPEPDAPQGEYSTTPAGAPTVVIGLNSDAAHPVELLAPAGGPDAAFAAFHYGADAIYLDEIRRAGLYDAIWQAFCVLLPVRSVGVMGDSRSYDYVLALRAVTSTDGMTADCYAFSHEFLSATATRLINEVRGINRVVYDVTSKPPGTIEWE